MTARDDADDEGDERDAPRHRAVVGAVKRRIDEAGRPAPRAGQGRPGSRSATPRKGKPHLCASRTERARLSFGATPLRKRRWPADDLR